MRSEDAGFHIITINNDYRIGISSSDDLPISLTKNGLRQFILDILKEKGLLQEDNQ